MATKIIARRDRQRRAGEIRDIPTTLGLKAAPATIQGIGDDILYADLCKAFNITRGERELPDLVRAMAAHIVELSRPKSPPKKSSGGRPTKWTPEALAALIVDVQREMAEGHSLSTATERLAAVEPWQRWMAEDGKEEGAPEALERAYNRAKKNKDAVALVEMFDGYRSSLGRDVWRAQTGQVIDAMRRAPREIERRVRERLKMLR